MSARGKGFRALRGAIKGGGDPIFKAIGTPSAGGVFGQAAPLGKAGLVRRGKRRAAIMGGLFMANGALTGRSSGGNGQVRKKSSGGYA